MPTLSPLYVSVFGSRYEKGIDVRYPTLASVVREIWKGEGDKDGVKDRGEEAAGCLQGL